MKHRLYTQTSSSIVVMWAALSTSKQPSILLVSIDNFQAYPKIINPFCACLYTNMASTIEHPWCLSFLLSQQIAPTVKNIHRKKHNHNTIAVIHSIEERTLPSCRKLLILINPFSGSGKSLKIFHEQVEPMLNEADIEFSQVTTGWLCSLCLAQFTSDWLYFS